MGAFETRECVTVTVGWGLMVGFETGECVPGGWGVGV